MKRVLYSTRNGPASAIHAMTGLIRHFITYLLGTKAIFNRPFLKV
ncbi:hypothetical protein HMPREF2531_02646 [Bacteroides intestinalis]|uniref:Uncharacterized protein n=1 Tax=Bacteroides intestinalis TaxID=329854 RepID=A0A139LCT3_9BACE|nr:hypothetical protein HMPREF2531_02646 [Bacteroides intestinalis]